MYFQLIENAILSDTRIEISNSANPNRESFSLNGRFRELDGSFAIIRKYKHVLRFNASVPIRYVQIIVKPVEVTHEEKCILLKRNLMIIPFDPDPVTV